MSKTKSSRPQIDFEYYKLRAQELRNETIHGLFTTGAKSIIRVLFSVLRIPGHHIDGRSNSAITHRGQRCVN
jgi:hypothetical protein